MTKLFGLPINSLMYGLLGALAAGLLVLIVTALRNPVLFKAGVRNITRRPAQTSLIILGLMLATLLFSSALVTGDTMSYSFKQNAIKNLGSTDVVIRSDAGANNAGFMGVKASAADLRDRYFKKEKYREIEEALPQDAVDGVTAVVREQVPAFSPKNRQNVPNLSLLAVESDYEREFGALTDESGKTLKVSGLGKAEGYLNAEAAKKFDVSKGDKLELFLGAKPVLVKVAGIFEKGGQPVSGAPAFILPASKIQAIGSRPGMYNEILISGKGDEIEGAKKTSAILDAVKSVVKGNLLEAKAEKRDALDQAESAASSFSSIFLVFGQFSMMAGVMLIFLIFIMLAAERKTELGVLRALGAQRRDILKMFTFEGVVYAVLAAAVGSVMGLAVGWGMVKILAKAFGNMGDFNFVFHLEPKSFIIAYALGVIATFVVVFFSAWRAGRINIVRAIRDIPEPKKTGRSIKRLILFIAMLVFGVLMTSSGLDSKQLTPFMIGTSFIIVGVPLIARYFRLPERIAFTSAGVGLLLWWLLPPNIFYEHLHLPKMKSGIEMFFISGISVVAGAIWAVMYNSDILLKVIVAVFGRLKGLPPMLKIAVNYPMKNRFRTGMALAMFSLIIFTMVFMGAIIQSVGSIYEDVDRLAGGFQIQASTGYANPISDVRKGLDGKDSKVRQSDFKAIGSFSMAGVEMRQAGAKEKKWVKYAIQGVDSGYADNSTYSFLLRADGYKTDRDVWKALRDEAGVAVVHANIVPAQVNYNMGNTPPDFMMSGFYRDGKKLPETFIEVRDPMTNKTTKLKVIGVINDMAVYTFNGVFTSQKTVDDIVSRPVPPMTYWFKTKPGVDVAATSRGLAKTFYENGMSTTVIEEFVDNMMETNIMMNRLLQGFMGLGLIVGIAALGVIAARSVVERRRQIGMLRAIGFRRGMVQNTFMLESSFVAVLGIVIGCALGLILWYSSREEFAKQMPGSKFAYPWDNIFIIGAVAYLASLLTTYLPARQAAKVYPAEALRYE